MVFLRWDIILRETRSGTTIVALVTNVCIIQNLAGRCRHPQRITSARCGFLRDVLIFQIVFHGDSVNLDPT